MPCAWGAARWFRVVRNSTRSNAETGAECTHAMHGRSRMTIYPRISTMPGRSTSDFHRQGRRCLRQARGAMSRAFELKIKDGSVASSGFHRKIRSVPVGVFEVNLNPKKLEKNRVQKRKCRSVSIESTPKQIFGFRSGNAENQIPKKMFGFRFTTLAVRCWVNRRKDDLHPLKKPLVR